MAPAIAPPFGWTLDPSVEPQPLTGALSGVVPDWLRGTLMRTAPAVYARGDWEARHWFDGLALLYSVTLRSEGGIELKQRLLESDVSKELGAGKRGRASFKTEMKRGFFERLFHPIPRTTDNTNVNVIPWEGQWLAMTETAHQHVIEGDTLRTRGAYPFKDGLGRTTLSAHPSLDPAAPGSLVNIGSEMGVRNALVIYRQRSGDPTRTIEGRVRLDRLPYVHSFAASERYATLLDHPFTVSPRDMLWSNRGFISHFEWAPQRGGRLWRLDRRDGSARAYETSAFFCFHTINQFEDGDDVVVDLLAWKDPSIIDALDLELLAKGHPPVEAKWVRARLKPNARSVDLEPMHGCAFEFPVVNWKAGLARPTSVVWGATIAGDDAAVVKVVAGHPEVRFTAKDWTHGEPVMVPRPGATAVDDGVLLAMASHRSGQRSALFVIDASTLVERARVEFAVGLPLGFHGSFRLSS